MSYEDFYCSGSKHVRHIGAKKRFLAVRVSLQPNLCVCWVSTHELDDQFLVMHMPPDIWLTHFINICMYKFPRLAFFPLEEKILLFC